MPRGRGGGGRDRCSFGVVLGSRRGRTERAPERPYVALVSRMLPQQCLLANRPALYAWGRRLCPAIGVRAMGALPRRSGAHIPDPPPR